MKRCQPFSTLGGCPPSRDRRDGRDRDGRVEEAATAGPRRGGASGGGGGGASSFLIQGHGPPSAQLASVAFAVLSARDFSTKARSSSQTGSEIVLKSIVTSAPFSGCLFSTIFTTSFRHSGGSLDTSTLSAWRISTFQRCIVGSGRRNADRCGASVFSGVTRGAGEPAASRGGARPQLCARRAPFRSLRPARLVVRQATTSRRVRARRTARSCGVWWCWEWFLLTSRLGTSMRGHSALGSERRSPVTSTARPLRLEDRCDL